MSYGEKKEKMEGRGREDRRNRKEGKNEIKKELKEGLLYQ